MSNGATVNCLHQDYNDRWSLRARYHVLSRTDSLGLFCIFGTMFGFAMIFNTIATPTHRRLIENGSATPHSHSLQGVMHVGGTDCQSPPRTVTSVAVVQAG
ncbi:hypothetical protein E4T56_gene1310 [Termitomyces sp. T112]|nr:hypothetical protein E4T56_gene1310 [Termitomyces sp. T112]